MNPEEQRSALKPRLSNRDEHLVSVLSLAFVAGMVVAMAFCGVWKFHPEWLNGSLEYLALTVCPSFLLVTVLGSFDNTLAIVMTIGTIVLANGFLYAGFAAGMYFVVTRFMLTRKSR